MYVPYVWRYRKLLAPFTMAVVAFTAAALAVAFPGFFTILLLFVSVLRVFNLMRIMHGLMHDNYLRIATRRTGLMLIGAQLLIAGLWAGWHFKHIPATVLWTGIAGLQMAAAVVLVSSTIRRLRRTAWPTSVHHYSDAELPTVTVAIPARNETDDLQLCLTSIISSDYPKLEVIVLDDCSQTRRTPEIIRAFAHDGVRFIPGSEPLDTWLPKNQAYDRLADEASGDLLLFCGVDIRFEPGAIRTMIAMMLERRKTMLSVLPDRDASVRHMRSPAQAIRYFWELVPPRRLFNKPSVLSSCWIITKKALAQAGGFEGVRRAITPEAHFARRIAVTDGYSFMRAGTILGVSSIKGPAEQRETAIRIRYPQLHRRPESVMLISWAEAGFLLLPFVLAILGGLFSAGVIARILAALAASLLVITYVLVARTTHVSSIVAAVVSLPAIIVYDLGMMYYSMWRYEFSVVDWKGRNICVPAMHVIPHLPKIG